ncbi:MAG: hypothetical protein ACPGUC_03720, partial [Gammaproteobacteria bacterium]
PLPRLIDLHDSATKRAARAAAKPAVKTEKKKVVRSKKAKAKAGPSCESCHGPASEWKEAHNDFGGVEKAKDEDPAHREQRIAKTKDMGMIWPSMLFDVASNCMSCHGLTKPGVEDALGKMLDAGHPIEPDFELVAYSQGSVRHRFYPPDVTVNKEMSKAELTRMFAVGQIAKLLSASEAAGNSSHPKYKAAQTERADQARAALKPVAGIGAVGAFLKAPSEKTARAAVAALEGEDLSAKLAGSLPAPSSYK